MFLKRGLLFVCLIVLTSVVFSCSQPTSNVVNDNNSDNKIIEKDPNKIRLLYTANLSKKLYVQSKTDWIDDAPAYEPVEPFAYLATIFKNKRNEGYETLTISGGNDYGGKFYDEFYGVATAVLLDKIGYNIITPDVNEFKDGESIYDASIKDTSYELLSGQTEFDTRSLIRRFKPYVIKEVNGHKIGVLSMNNLHGTKFGKQLPITQTNPNYVQDRASVVNFRTKQMREEGAQLTILLEDYNKYREITEMLKNDMLNVDFVIFPSVNKKYFSDKTFDMQGAVTKLGKKKTPLFVYIDDYVADLYVLQIDIEFSTDADGKTSFNYSHKLFEVTGDTPEDTEVKKMVDGFISQLP